ncbi:Maf family protein [Desulfocucumis palustris]|uniref:Maf family protein n=1 Tax=Desulfocucumis palustris TaxID=1898651 RepID=UPI001A9A6303
MLPIYLASSSPRRRELMEQMGLRFSVVSRPVDETVDEKLSPEEVVKSLSARKALAVSREIDRGLVIGSDTVVVWQGKIMGKPVSDADALDMLRCLQGNEHSVYSGLAVIDASDGRMVCTHERTRVFFRPAGDDELKLYVNTGEPMDKAGAYAIQGRGAVFVSGIEGCYSNVVGLPLFLLASVLKDFGVNVLGSDMN